MKGVVALGLVLVVVAVLLPDDTDALPSPRRSLRFRHPKAVAGNRRRSTFPRPVARKGKTLGAQDYPDYDAAGAADGEGEVPEWCDWPQPMGAWLNFGTLRAICGDRGFTEFGPYGGVSSEGGEGEDVAA